MSAPRDASIVTNLRCNQACSWCTRRAAHDDASSVRGAAVRARIDAALREGSREIVLTGGEPTMRGDLVDLVRHARSGGASRVVLETNAALLDRTRARELREAGLDAARVHVPALGKAYDAITRDEGAFVRALAGMQALASEGLTLEAAVTLARSARPTLEDVPGHLRDAPGPALRGLVVGFPVDAADPAELLSFEEAAGATLALERAARPHELALRMSTGDPLPVCAFEPADRSRAVRLYAMTAGAPPRAGYSQRPACNACRVSDRCPGVADAYVARFGAPAMHPVADARTRRRLAVVSSVEEQIERELASRHVFADQAGRPQIEEIVRVVFRCNQSCTFCFVSTHLPAPAPAAIEAAIVAAGRRGSARIVLSGGEPTLSPQLLEWIRLARSVSTGRVVLQTNAVRLEDPALVAELDQAGLDEAFVSLHGATPEVSDAVTEAPGTYRRTVAGIDRLHASRIAVVLNYVICEKNRHELVAHIRHVATRWPRAEVNLSFVGPSTDLVPREASLVPRYTDALPVIAEAIEESRRLGVSLIGFESMCGLPLCLVPGGVRERDLIDVPAANNEFLKTDECARCALDKRCYGIRRGYAEIHGTTELRQSEAPGAKRREPSVLGELEGYPLERDSVTPPKREHHDDHPVEEGMGEDARREAPEGAGHGPPEKAGAQRRDEQSRVETGAWTGVGSQRPRRRGIRQGVEPGRPHPGGAGADPISQELGHHSPPHHLLGQRNRRDRSRDSGRVRLQQSRVPDLTVKRHEPDLAARSDGRDDP
jgi:MoaA/NifB/PqqE/SkfB family radical SAM enzyme